MNADALMKVLSGVHPLSKAFEKSLLKELIPVSFPKNYLIVEIPRVAGHVYFLENGFAMSYSFEKRKKIVEGFWKKDQLVTSTTSFCEQVPSKENIQLMADSDLIGFSFQSLQKLFELHQETHYLYHKIIYRHYEQSRARIYEIQRRSAAERFEKLQHTFPDIEQYVPQESIASYLAITPQSLSRIKRAKEGGEPMLQ